MCKNDPSPIERQLQVCCDENTPCVLINNNNLNNKKVIVSSVITTIETLAATEGKKQQQIQQQQVKKQQDDLHRGKNPHSKKLKEQEELEKSDREQQILLKANKQNIIDF